MIQDFIDDNKKYSNKNQKDTDATLDKINKWMKKIMYKFDKASPKKVETNKPQD